MVLSTIHPATHSAIHPASTVVRARSARHARDAWARLVTKNGERRAFAEVAAYAGGSDAAHRVLARHDIPTDL